MLKLMNEVHKTFEKKNERFDELSWSEKAAEDEAQSIKDDLKTAQEERDEAKSKLEKQVSGLTIEKKKQTLEYEVLKWR